LLPRSHAERTDRGATDLLFCYLSLMTYYRNIYLYTTHEGITEAHEIFLGDTHVLPKSLNLNEYCRRDPIAVKSLSTAGVNTVNLLVAFHNIHGRKGEVLLILIFLSISNRWLMKIAKCESQIRISCTVQMVGQKKIG
jgi:hypothetical protein